MAQDAKPTLQLYDTFAREKRAFEPIDAANVRMYACGPTVYDFAHIGNARPVIVFDVLYRMLRHVYGEDHVTYVRNITDVDDKINARAARDYPNLPLNDAIRKVTEKTADQFHTDVKRLGCLEPTVEPRATEFILPRPDGKSDMVSLIQTLLDKGNAYVAKGREGREVLFDTASMPAYGRLSQRKLDEQQAGARIEVEAHKKTPADFVLWKESSSNEPGWDATFSTKGKSETIYGRPGWHIECSAMSAAYLGETFDIHGGGLDLIFPHHENERAQSCCAHDTERMANYWMHNGFLQVEGKKMSKSEGNFVTINELLDTESFGKFAWPGQVLRYAMLLTNYREPIDFSVKRLEEASMELSKFSRFIEDTPPTEVPAEFIRALSDDLNTSAAIAYLRQLSSMPPALATKVEAGEGIADASTGFDNDTLRRGQLAASLQLLGVEMASFDKNWATNSVSHSKQANIEELKNARLDALNAKDFAKADAIRDELAAQGIQLMDYKDPDTGERKTKWEVKR